MSPRATPRLAAVAAAAAVTSACASVPPSAAPPQALQLSPGVWRLSSAAAWRPAATLDALRRAADLTLAQGGDWFRVRDRQRGPDGDGWGFGEGVGDAGDTLSDPGPLAVSTLEIEIGRGPKPTADPDAYDARSVEAGTRGVRPGPPPPTGASRA